MNTEGAVNLISASPSVLLSLALSIKRLSSWGTNCGCVVAYRVHRAGARAQTPAAGAAVVHTDERIAGSSAPPSQTHTTPWRDKLRGLMSPVCERCTSYTPVTRATCLFSSEIPCHRAEISGDGVVSSLSMLIGRSTCHRLNRPVNRLDQMTQDDEKNIT